MTFPRSRTVISSLICLLAVIATVGCLSGAGVSPDEAKERALAAEEEHITDQLENASCVKSWSPISFVGIEENATVINQTAEGVFVEVTHPYSYSTERDEADYRSEARYRITAEDEERISGTKVSPC